MRLCSIASGSSGNCIYVGSDTTHLLVDVGISKKKTEEGLKKLDLSLEDMDGILITHEHADHIQGLGVILRKKAIPVYATADTIAEIMRTRSLGEFDTDLFHAIDADHRFSIKDIIVDPMHISHDAKDPVAYRFKIDGHNAAIATDMGVYNDYTVECLKGMDILFLEANHDIRMLETGPYPYYLKKRILGDHGHLSNEASGQLLTRILHDGMQAVMLVHLSKENNLPELAYETVRVEVTMADPDLHAKDIPLYVAKRSEPSDILCVGE